MTNSSLYAHLHGTHSAECLLDWRRRASIAIGTARALLYLHHNATPQTIHGSIKATNVLLDSEHQAHVGDFGLLRLIPDGMDHEKIASENQRGYIAPEYIMFGKPTAGCDVYSFGIILLELASGKRPIEKSGSVKTYGIRNWVLPLAKEGRYDEIADPKLSDKYSESELKRMVLIGDGLYLILIGDRVLFEEVMFALKDAHLSLEALPADVPFFVDIDPENLGKSFEE
ncbi:hypothetical protein QOZ80_6BG0462220 [Eleusine coracana subsp. coracana]|nr:hypothetical protein QOZ80_6BG0462220 [Eleusine coracana subsp. coracana]